MRRVLASVGLAGVLAAAPACMTDFAEDQEAAVATGPWLAQWILQTFSEGTETMIDVQCKGLMRITKDNKWFEVNYKREFSVDSVYRHVKEHPKFDWFDHLTIFEGAAAVLMDADFAMAAVETVQELVEQGADLDAFEYEMDKQSVKCRAKARRTPPTRPGPGIGNCPLSVDGCPENPDSEWPWSDPQPVEPSFVPGHGDQ